MHKTFLTLAAGCSVLCSAAAPKQLLIPQVESRWIKNDILTRQESHPWNLAAVCHSFVQIADPGKEAVKNVQSRLFHDREKLYFAFFRALETASICNAVNRDDAVWGDDSFMLFIAPDAEKRDNYYQIVINAKGAIYDEERLPGNNFNVKKDFRTLKTNIFAGERGWMLYGSIDLAELGITPGRKFAVNFASRRKETNGADEYSTFAPLARPTFLCPESFVTATLGKVMTKPPVYSFSQKPELCIDGEVEFGTHSRWVRRNGAGSSRWYKGSGSHSIAMVNSKFPGKTFNWFHPLALKGNERYILSFICRYGTCETPNLVPARIHCFDKNNKKLAVIDGPGIGNMGGGAGNYLFAPYKKDFVTPKGTVRAELEVRLVDIGTVYLDAVSVRPYTQVTHVPVLKFPAGNAVIRQLRVNLKWDLFARADLRPGTLTLQFSKDAAFPENKTLTFDGCAYDPADKSGWYEDLPEQGKWFWRARFDGEDGGVWSKTSTFTIDFDKSNEKISPVISGLAPRGRMASRAPEYRINFTDGKVSSGIKSVKLLINGAKTACRSDENGVFFTLPDDGKTFYSVQLDVTDNNGNTATEHDFIAISPGKGKVSLDAKGFITVDGKRIFPIAGYAHMRPQDFAAMKKLNYNGNFNPWVTPVNPECWNFAAAAGQNGFYLVPIALPEYLWGKGIIKTDTRAARRFYENEINAIAKLQGHPAVIGVCLGDESIDAGYKLPVFQEFYRMIKKAAPDMIVHWLPTYGQTNSYAWKGAVTACDMLWHDDYVSQRNQHLLLFKDIDRIMGWVNNKPFINIVGCHAPSTDWKKEVKRFPSYEDIRYCTWAAIVAGSRGTITYEQPIYRASSYNPYAQTNAPDYQQRIVRVLAEVKTATPYILSDELPAVKTRVLSGNVRILERVANGKTFVAAVNSGETPAEIKLGSGKKITLPRLGVAIEYY